jgi:rubrerythrin
MKEADILKDLLHYKISSEKEFNEIAINVRNPEVRQLFIQMRDDEMRHIARIQQKIERVETKPRIIARIIPSKTRS